MRNLVQPAVDLLIAWRIPLLFFAVFTAAVALAPARRLSFDRSIENMFAPDDPLLAPYRQLKRTFGGNEIVVAVYTDEHLFDSDGSGLERLTAIRRRMEAVPGVKGVLSIDQPLGEAIAQDTPLAQRVRKLFEGYTHGADGRTVSIGCMLATDAETDVPRAETIEELRRIVEPLPSGMLTGEPVMVSVGFESVEADGRRLGWASTVLLGATIIACFHSLRWVLLPIAVVQLTLLLTRAILAWSGVRLSMVSSMLTAIVTVVGVGTMIHIIVRFREARRRGLLPREALAATMVLLAAPVFWALATDAVGFGSLALNRVGPIKDFGIMMAIGSLLVLVSTILLLPGMALVGPLDRDPRRAWGENHLDAALQRLVHTVRRWPKTVGAAALTVSAVAIAGIGRLEVETDFTRNFRAGSPIVRSYAFVESNLGGAGVWDIILPAPASLDWAYLRRVRHLEERLRREITTPGPEGQPVPELTKILSLADIGSAASSVDLDRVPLAVVRDALLRTGLKTVAERMPVFYQALHGEDPLHPGQYYLRVMLRAHERQPAGQKEHLIAQVKRISREEFPPTAGSQGAQVTGLFVLLANLIHSVVRDQWITFGAATAGIGLMMLIALRSPILALLALVPNALPILIVTGLIGWLGLKINLGAAMIAAVSMGLSIDASIHYITFFRRTRQAGQSVAEAIAAAHQTVGRAMVFSTLALVIGFLVLVTSEFVPTVYFGTLVSLAMLGGLAGNLVVLPLLLTMVSQEGKPNGAPAHENRLW